VGAGLAPPSHPVHDSSVELLPRQMQALAAAAMVTTDWVSLHGRRFGPASGYQIPFESEAVRTMASTHQGDDVPMQCPIDRFGFHADLFDLRRRVPHRELYVVHGLINWTKKSLNASTFANEGRRSEG
jgi:hypothetical protein